MIKKLQLSQLFNIKITKYIFYYINNIFLNYRLKRIIEMRPFPAAKAV